VQDATSEKGTGKKVPANELRKEVKERSRNAGYRWPVQGEQQELPPSTDTLGDRMRREMKEKNFLSSRGPPIGSKEEPVERPLKVGEEKD